MCVSVPMTVTAARSMGYLAHNHLCRAVPDVCHLMDPRTVSQRPRIIFLQKEKRSRASLITKESRHSR